MNVHDLKKLLHELTDLPLELLNAADIRKYANTFAKFRDQLQKTSLLVELRNLDLEVPHGERALYETLMKAKKIKKPAKTAPLSSYVAYEKRYRTAFEEVRREIAKSGAQLAKIRRSPDEEALSTLAGLDAEARKRLSRLANLTKQTGRGVALFSITTSKKNHLDWLAELRSSKIDPELFA